MLLLPMQNSSFSLVLLMYPGHTTFFCFNVIFSPSSRSKMYISSALSYPCTSWKVGPRGGGSIYIYIKAFRSMIKSMLAWCIPKSNVDVELLVVISMISKDQRVFNHFIVLTWGQEPIDCTSCAVESLDLAGTSHVCGHSVGGRRLRKLNQQQQGQQWRCRR